MFTITGYIILGVMFIFMFGHVLIPLIPNRWSRENWSANRKAKWVREVWLPKQKKH